MQVHLAIDLGAESGRIIAVWVDRGAVSFREMHRFGHRPIVLPTGLHWNITHIWSEIVSGLQMASTWANDNRHEVISVGADAWGVDWCLVSENGELAGLPHAYRDPRNHKYYDEAVRRLSLERIYQTTGIQLMPINSLYSLYAMCEIEPALAATAWRFLFIPDLIHFWLSGTMVVERTIASTSQMVDPRTGKWATDLLEALGMPTNFLGEIVSAGTRLGKIRSELAQQTGLAANVEVIAPGSHDTASAVAAVPAEQGTDWCYISSGTWSLLGCELNESLTTIASQQAMFTNEAGIGNSIRFLKNIAGLWLVQECRRDWQLKGQAFEYAELVRLAGAAEAFRTLVDPNWAPFQLPGEMPAKIARFAELTGQSVPQNPGAFIRCALESLALAYRQTIEAMESVTGRVFKIIHIVGGGGQNELLNQLTADCTSRKVVAGPVEATAIGNGLVQAIAMGTIRDLNDLRRTVREGIVDLKHYSPAPKAINPEVLNRFSKLRNLPST